MARDVAVFLEEFIREELRRAYSIYVAIPLLLALGGFLMVRLTQLDGRFGSVYVLLLLLSFLSIVFQSIVNGSILLSVLISVAVWVGGIIGTGFAVHVATLNASYTPLLLAILSGGLAMCFPAHLFGIALAEMYSIRTLQTDEIKASFIAVGSLEIIILLAYSDTALRHII